MKNRIISILVLVCFFSTHVTAHRIRSAEAVVPVVPILVEAVVSMLISAGVTYGVNAYGEHIARTEIDKLTTEQKRALEMEGGLSELTVNDVKKYGIKPKTGTKKVFKLKGAGKAALIGGILSVGISGLPYLIDFVTSEEVEQVEGYECTIDKTGLVLKNQGTRTFVAGESNDIGYYYSNYYNVPNILYLETDIIRKTSSKPAYVNARFIYASTGSSFGGSYGNHVKSYINKNDNIWVTVSDGHIYNGFVETEPGYYARFIYNLGAMEDGSELEVSYKVYTSDIEKLNSRYTGEVDVDVEHTEYVDLVRDRLEQVKQQEEKVIFIMPQEDGTVDIKTGTELSDGQIVPDSDIGEDSPIIPDEPDEGDKPDLRKLYGVVTTRWPFSLPWDVAYLLNIVFADPVPPKWTFTLPENFGSHEFTVDMTQLEGFMPVLRWFITFAFCFGIVFAIRKLYGGSV